MTLINKLNIITICRNKQEQKCWTFNSPHTYDEEKETEATCLAMQDLGYGLTWEMVAQVVTEYLVFIRRLNPFQKGVPGPDWWALFLKRWPQLRERNEKTSPRRNSCCGRC